MKRRALALVAIAALVLAGCIEGETDGGLKAAPSDVATTQQQQSEEAQKQLTEGTIVEISIADGSVSPRGKRVEVKVGEPVTLRVTSDAADEIHVHSDPEHEMSVKPGDRNKELTFKLKVPGQVAVESHHVHATIVQLVVTP